MNVKTRGWLAAMAVSLLLAPSARGQDSAGQEQDKPAAKPTKAPATLSVPLKKLIEENATQVRTSLMAISRVENRQTVKPVAEVVVDPARAIATITLAKDTTLRLSEIENCLQAAPLKIEIDRARLTFAGDVILEVEGPANRSDADDLQKALQKSGMFEKLTASAPIVDEDDPEMPGSLTVHCGACTSSATYNALTAAVRKVDKSWKVRDILWSSAGSVRS